MANSARNALMHLERVGDPRSPKNIKTRKAALQIATAICRNYPIPKLHTFGVGSVIRLPGGYALHRYCLEDCSGIILFLPQLIHHHLRSESGSRESYDILDGYDIGSAWKKQDSEVDSLLDLEMAEQLAMDVAEDLLERIRDQIVDNCGEEAGVKFWIAVGH